MSNEEYQKAYMDGYMAGLEKGRAEAEDSAKPFVTVEDLMERYGCGKNKASEIMRAIRRVSNGGSLGTRGKVKRTEMLYWESRVDKTFLVNLRAMTAK